MTKRFLGILVLGLLLVGCASTPLITKKADPNLYNEAINFSISENISRIYFLTGSCDAPLKKWDCAGAGGIFVNGKYIGGINKTDAMVVDLKPGNYEFLWHYNTNYQKKSFGIKNVPLNINLNAGEFTILKLSALAGSRRGLLGAALAPDKYVVEIIKDKSLILNKNIVVPIN